jgi:hypothetical protein
VIQDEVANGRQGQAMKKSVIRQATDALGDLARLAFLALAGTFLFVVFVLVANLTLYVAAQVTHTLFDLIRFIFKG